jgi:predicted  nucleic acid-binding Zn-ribbon protein
MDKAANVIKDLFLGKPEQRFQDVSTDLDNIKSEISLTNKKITNLIANGDPKLSEEELQKQISDLKIEKAGLNKKLIAKQEQISDLRKEYKNRKSEEYKDAVNERQAAYVENTGKQAKNTAKAIAEAKIAVRKARLAMRNRTHRRFVPNNRTQGGKRKSQKKRHTSKRK